MKQEQHQYQSTATYTWGEYLLVLKMNQELTILRQASITQVDPVQGGLKIYVDGRVEYISELMDNGDLEDMIYNMTKAQIESER